MAIDLQHSISHPNRDGEDRSDAPSTRSAIIAAGSRRVCAVIFTSNVRGAPRGGLLRASAIGLNVMQGAKRWRHKITASPDPVREPWLGIRHDALPEPERHPQHLDAIVQADRLLLRYSCRVLGNTTTMRQALECCHKELGQSLSSVLRRPSEIITARSSS